MMEDGVRHYKQQTPAGRITLHILQAKRRTQCDDVGMHAYFVQLHWFRANAPSAPFTFCFCVSFSTYLLTLGNSVLVAARLCMRGATKHREDLLADVSVFLDFQVTGRLRGETQRSQGVTPNFSRPLEWIYKHSSNARHVISMCSPTNSRENKTCPAKHFKVDKGGKEEGWSSPRTGVTPSSPFTDVYSIYLFSLILTLRLLNMGLESWHGFATSLQRKTQRYLVSKEVHYVQICWRDSHTSYGSISGLLKGKRIKDGEEVPQMHIS